MFFLYLSVDIAGSGNPCWQRPFVNGVPTARNGQMDPLFFSNGVILIYFVHEAAKNRAKQETKTLQKDVFFLTTR